MIMKALCTSCLSPSVHTNSAVEKQTAIFIAMEIGRPPVMLSVHPTPTKLRSLLAVYSTTQELLLSLLLLDRTRITLLEKDSAVGN